MAGLWVLFCPVGVTLHLFLGTAFLSEQWVNVDSLCFPFSCLSPAICGSPSGDRVKLSNVLGLIHSSKEHRDHSFELLSQRKTGHDAPGCEKAGTTSQPFESGEHGT